MGEITLFKFNNIKMCFNTDEFRVHNTFHLKINIIKKKTEKMIIFCLLK